jgi:hypothetical protein
VRHLSLVIKIRARLALTLAVSYLRVYLFRVGLNHPEICRYEDFSRSDWFEKDPSLAWGINYSQIKAYREAPVHAGYKALLQIVQRKEHDYFCWTSNIDGVLQRAGFDSNRVRECHGNIHRLQCSQRAVRTSALESLLASVRTAVVDSADAIATTASAASASAAPAPPAPPALPPTSPAVLPAAICTEKSQGPWETGTDMHPLVELELEQGQEGGVEGAGHRCVGKLPTCIHCGALARPNVMFCHDTNYMVSDKGSEVNSGYYAWLDACKGIVVNSGYYAWLDACKGIVAHVNSGNCA